MKATLIHRYDGTVKLVYGGDLMREEMDFLNSDDAMKFADHFDIEIGVVHGQGAHILGNVIAEDFEQRDDSRRFEKEVRATR